MIYCNQCGYQNEDSSKFCSKCGELLNKVASPTEITQSFAPIEPEPEEELPLTEESYGETAILLVKKGPNFGEKFYLTKEEIMLGRDPTSDIFLNDITVSRKHAKISMEGSNFIIADIGSLNGTYINQERVERATLKAGDELQIGKFKLLFLAKR